MSKIKLELNSQGVRELLHDPNILSVCKDCADNVLSAAGEGYKEESRNYPDRGGYAVKVDSAKTYYQNLKNNTLLKALGK